MAIEPRLSDPTKRLASFVAELRYEDLPDEVRARTKDLLLDSLACALAGHRGDEALQVAALARAIGSDGDTTVIGGGTLSQVGATLLNGYLITAITACDVYRPAFSHVTPGTVPPALAVAEHHHSSGRDLLVALAAGFEVATRVGLGLNYPAFRARGWQAPGVIGPFGGAAAAGKLRGSDADRLVMALGLAGSQAAGTSADWGTPGMKFQQLRGGLSGLIAALLAAEGFVASSRILEAPDGGLYHVYSDGGATELVTQDLGRRWELMHIGLRRWPASSSLQGMLTALFELIGRSPRVALEVVEQVEIVLSPTSFQLHGSIPRPSGKFQCLQSAHYVATVALADAELWLDQFEPQRASDPALRRFMERAVTIRADPDLQGPAARVRLKLHHGPGLEAQCTVPRGDPDNPLTQSEIASKFRAAAARLAPNVREEVMQAVAELERVDDLAALLPLLR